jgi:preprotein translocase subunit SecB
LRETSLLLERYFYPKISIQADPKYQPAAAPLLAEISVSTHFTKLAEAGRKWAVTISIKTSTKDHPIPYKIDLSAVGYFRIAPDYPEEEVEKLIRIGGPTVLYSAARELILTISSRGPWGPVFIPSMSFLETPKETKKPKEKEREEGEQVSKLEQQEKDVTSPEE